MASGIGSANDGSRGCPWSRRISSAVWTDGQKKELKTYYLSCDGCRAKHLALASAKHAACALTDGESLLPLVHDAVPPPGWRSEVHYEYDFRDIFYSRPESALGLAMDECSLAVIQDEHYKYVHFAALPPLFFNLVKDPGQLHNVAEAADYAPLVLRYAQKMLDWRLRHAERTLTGYAATPDGLASRP